MFLCVCVWGGGVDMGPRLPKSGPERQVRLWCWLHESVLKVTESRWCHSG